VVVVEGQPADPLVGTVLDGRYSVRQRLAHGGMATVYVALDTRLDRPVAVKVMHPALAADPSFVARFTREAHAAARITHPHVVAVHDQGTDAATGAVFLVMELVRGRTLRDLLLARRRLTPAEALDLLEPVADALAAAHACGLVHRDVKPENVLLGDDGRVLVADFGLARAVEASPLTAAAGLLIGTVGYLAPEQVASGAADARTDIYAAGILLWEMLRGHAPYDAETPLAVAYRHLHEDVPAPGVSPEVDALVLAMTRRDPAGRPPDGGALLAAVRVVRRGLPATGVAATTPLPLETRRAEPPTQAMTAPSASPAWSPVAGPPAYPHAPPQPAAHAGRTSAPPALVPRRRRGLALALTLLLLLTTAAAVAGGWWLGYGRWTSTPSFVSLAPTAATTQARAQGLSVSLADPVSSETVPAGEVASQEPAPGARAHRGQLVQLHLSLGPVLHTVPAVPRGSPPSRASTLLHGAQLGLGTTSGEYDENVAAGAVLRTVPAAGTRLPTGRPVALVVSRGPHPVPVPQLAGRSLDDAEAAAHAARVTLAASEVFSDSVPSGTVVDQALPTGTPVQPGASLVVHVSRGPEFVRVPGVGGGSVATAHRELERLGLVVRERHVPSIGLGLVVNQDVQLGTMVHPGTVVTITIV